MIAALLLAAAAGCGPASSALARAESSWTAFVNGDFVSAAAAAEVQREKAIASLAEADREAAACKADPTALDRAELHFEIDLVDARRNRGSSASLTALNADLARLRDLGLPRTQPARYDAYVQRDREMQAETRGGLVVAPPIVPPGARSAAPGSCIQTDTTPIPLAPIVPVMLDPAHLHALHGATVVSVLVGPTGGVLSATVVASSGDPVLDQAVVGATRLVPYAPARHACEPTTGQYTMSYAFPQM